MGNGFPNNEGNLIYMTTLPTILCTRNEIQTLNNIVDTKVYILEPNSTTTYIINL